ncbi:hypothetical protein [uncultured Desulfovibrio sp.]|uniref:hypothetical protein n=1 Tax=uncultured Desulfovibrio sp. TaxID=167968 RepID=UPI0027120ABD|nr:hypothetical protein [uncultured Desulfovibrio sp.]
MRKLHSSCTFGSCISDITCDILQEKYNVKKNFALYQWRSDQFIQTVIQGVPFIPEGLEKILKLYLDPQKGEGILCAQKKKHIELWLESVASSDIILIDNLMDLNIIIYSEVYGCDKKTSVQIRHRFKNNFSIPFILHEQPPLEEVVANNKEIIKFIQRINPNISLWYLNYPYSTHLVTHPTKAQKIQTLAKMMWKGVPGIRQIPSFNISDMLSKDRWHFTNKFYASIASYIMQGELNNSTMNLSPIMNFNDFCYILSKKI